MELSYRRNAVAGASTIGLMIALYDTLSGNLRRAAAAIRNNNIEDRCTQLNHALLVLGQLENMMDKSSDLDLNASLATFYAYLRSQMLTASLEKNASMLEAQISLILQVRTAWQQRDLAAGPAVPAGMLAGETVSADRASFSLSM